MATLYRPFRNVLKYVLMARAERQRRDPTYTVENFAGLDLRVPGRITLGPAYLAGC
jgi:hypothetical protein